MGKDFKFSARDITAIREGAIQAFQTLPSRCRLKGMTTDLTESDKQVLCWTGAVMLHLNRVGITPPELTQGFYPEPFVEVQEVIEEETGSTPVKESK